MVDAEVSKTSTYGCAGSSPAWGTRTMRDGGNGPCADRHARSMSNRMVDGYPKPVRCRFESYLPSKGGCGEIGKRTSFPEREFPFQTLVAQYHADMGELVDPSSSEGDAVRRVGSTPTIRTKIKSRSASP